MKFILLAGLPGSGKTTYGQGLGFPFLDDFTQKGGDLATIGWLKPHPVAVISDFFFIYPDIQKVAIEKIRAKFPEAEFEWVAWENNPEQCARNVLARRDQRIISTFTIYQAAKRYKIPDGATVRPVYISPKPPE